MQNQEPTVLRPILVDIVGATVAGIAMLWQILSIFLGQKLIHAPLNRNPQGIFAAPFLVMSVIGYMLKDRIKEWGKRCACHVTSHAHVMSYALTLKPFPAVLDA